MIVHPPHVRQVADSSDRGRETLVLTPRGDVYAVDTRLPPPLRLRAFDIIRRAPPLRPQPVRGWFARLLGAA